MYFMSKNDNEVKQAMILFMKEMQTESKKAKVSSQWIMVLSVLRYVFVSNQKSYLIYPRLAL